MIKDTFELVLTSSRHLTPGVLHMVFTRADGAAFKFIPGQFITFHFDHADESLHRSYSVATIPGSDQQTIEIAVGYFPGGPATELLYHLQPGQKLITTGPFGRLVLRDEQPARYILVATGTGVAPYRAMLTELSQRLQQSNLQVDLLLGVQGREHLLYGDDFLAFAAKHPNFRFHACYSREQASDLKPFEMKGYVQERFDTLALDPAQDIIYLCGNPSMIDDSFEQLKEVGFDTKQVRREKYIST